MYFFHEKNNCWERSSLILNMSRLEGDPRRSIGRGWTGVVLG